MQMLRLLPSFFLTLRARFGRLTVLHKGWLQFELVPADVAACLRKKNVAIGCGKYRCHRHLHKERFNSEQNIYTPHIRVDRPTSGLERCQLRLWLDGFGGVSILCSKTHLIGRQLRNGLCSCLWLA